MNATKYEAVAFVDVHDITMEVQGGTYLLTIAVIPVTLDITQVTQFITTNITGAGTVGVDIQGVPGVTANLVILRTVNPIPPGKLFFTVGLEPFSTSPTLPGPFTELEREVELWILPPARRFTLHQCMSSYVYCILQ